MIIKLIKVKSFFSLLVIVLSSIIFPQNVDSLDQSKFYPFIVDSIKIIGNQTTENFIILRELNFNIGDTLTKANAYYNRERVYSLGIFNRVNFYPTIIKNMRILKIEVEESWYIYPIPYLQLQEGDWSKLSYGASLKLKNFRGRNEDLTAFFAFGYDPTFYLSYYNPNMVGRENIYFRSTLGYSDVANKSPTAENLFGQVFSQKFIYFNLLVGKRFDIFNRLYLSSGFSYIETPFFINGISASNNRIDNVVSLRDNSVIVNSSNYISTNFDLTQKFNKNPPLPYHLFWCH